MKELLNDFSWSLSRDNLFHFCERAYFYHYYGSWEGWGRYADPETHTLYRLKNLQTWNQLLGDLIKSSISDLSDQSDQSDSFLRILNKRFSRMMFSLKMKEYETDAGKPCIDDVYYGKISIREFEDNCRKMLEQFRNYLSRTSMLNDLLSVPVYARIDTSKPLSFCIDGLKIYTSSDFAHRMGGGISFVNLYFNDNDDLNWAYRTGLLALYSFSVFHGIDESAIECKSYFMDNISAVHWKHPVTEILNIIRDSSSEMRSRLTETGKAYKENFSITDDMGKCEKCRFREVC